MAEDIEKVNRTTTQSGDTVEQTTETSNSRDTSQHRTNVIARIIWYIAGILIALLGLRFILTLLGANTTNSFANFIYETSHPFVAPFFSLFSYRNYIYGKSHFEVYTLVAMLIYALVAWGLVKLVSLNQD